MAQTQRNVRRMKPPRSPVAVDRNNPQGVARCDGCDRVVPYPLLRPLMAFSGTPRQPGSTSITATHMFGPGGGPGGPLYNTGLRMCPACQDVPNPQFMPQVLGPDPVPLEFPRTDSDNQFYIVTQSGFVLITEDNRPLQGS